MSNLHAHYHFELDWDHYTKGKWGESWQRVAHLQNQNYLVTKNLNV